MNFRNPTALRIGMSGLLEGLRYTVLGRVTLGVEVERETYYWEEFYLGNEEGGVVTLVFEEMESGPTWKLFKDFDPPRPLTAQEAGRKRLGEVIELGGVTARITLVDSSRVYHIEGDAPGGTEVGDTADYFNAESGSTMIVVSWTGDEVEYYKGRDLPRGFAESAFGLPAPRAASSQFFGSSIDWSLGSLDGATLRAVVGVAVFALFMLWSLAARSCDGDISNPEPPAKVAAPARPLPFGVVGSLAGHRYEVVGYALVEVNQLFRRFDRHEYLLKDEAGHPALLIQGLNADNAVWHLLTPVPVGSGFTPYDAAALRSGQQVKYSGHTYQVRQLVQANALNLEGAPAAVVWPSRISYGFVASENDDWLLARWSETELQIYQGRSYSAAEVRAALNKIP